MNSISGIFGLLFISTVFLGCSGLRLPVHNEPMHQTVFKSSKARILDIRFPPGDTCLYHEHSKNYYYYALKGGKCFVQNLGTPGKDLKLPTGYSGGKFDMPKEKFVHRVANLSTDTIKYIAVESLTSREIELPEFEPSSIESLRDDNSVFRVIDISIPPKREYNFEFDNPMLLINPEYKKFNINAIEIDQPWGWFETGNELRIFNNSSDTLTLTAIILK